MKIYSFLIPILAIFASSFANEAAPKPNLIIVFCDDLGYADIGPFGSKKHATPVLDRMAEEGMRLTDFYSTCPVCTPSRSSLMTGCYPRRVNMHVDEKNLCVLFPAARKGLNPSETTIAEVLKEQGYATACIGKWHLGDHPDFMPTNHGFDSYFGIPYSNDMNRKTVPLPLVRDLTVIEDSVQRSLYRFKIALHSCACLSPQKTTLTLRAASVSPITESPKQVRRLMWREVV